MRETLLNAMRERGGVAIDDRRHLSVAPRAQVRGGLQLVVHRHRGFEIGLPWTTFRNGKTVARVEHAVIDSWPLLAPGERRGPAIAAVGEGYTTGARLLGTLRRCGPTDGCRVDARVV
jgi:hypothetical protein